MTEENRRHEYIMTSLRTSEGLNLAYFTERFSLAETEALLEKLYQYQKLPNGEEEERVLITGDRILLTDQGKLFADGIASYLF